MAWNPSPEVAVARDTAKALRARQVVVLYITDDDKLGYASYGRTREMCEQARMLGEAVYETAMTEISEWQ